MEKRRASAAATPLARQGTESRAQRSFRPRPGDATASFWTSVKSSVVVCKHPENVFLTANDRSPPECSYAADRGGAVGLVQPARTLPYRA